MIASLPRSVRFFALTVAIALAVYWPSLHGGYLFDDGIYFVDNPDVHVTDLRLASWVRAAHAQCSVNPLCRPLSSLSFAATYYLSGIDPFWAKLSNVFIHLLNGLLLFLCLRELLAWKVPDRVYAEQRKMVAAVIAGAWLLLPINLTGVAYLSQRMESLANLFVLLGLFWYARARCRQFAGGGAGALWVGLIGCTLAALSAKEDGALLPLYTACLEIALFRFRNERGRVARSVVLLHVFVLVVPFVLGLLWITPRLLAGLATYRDFTLGERLLTESRVLVDYIQWTLLPNLNALTFYHDDMPLSHGLWDPPTTLLSILALLALLALALWRRNRQPLFCLGILWFFAGHSMTATVVPLELVFEHRNYFPSIGLLLSAASVVALEPGLRFPALRTALACAALAFFAFITLLRSEEWSHPLRLAYAEALKRPASARAQYELARTLLLAAGDHGESPLLAESERILERNADRQESGITPLQGLIYVAARQNRPIDLRWWKTMVQKLRARAPSQADISAIIFLYRCQRRGECPKQTQELLDVFVAGLDRSEGNPNLLSAYAEFALTELDDGDLAERMARAAVAAKPQLAVYRENLIRVLIATGKSDSAQAELTNLERLNRFGALDANLAELRKLLAGTPAAGLREAVPESSQPDKLSHD